MIFARRKTPEPLIKIPLQFFRDEGQRDMLSKLLISRSLLIPQLSGEQL